MSNDAVLTSKEVCQQYHINKYTLLNWRRGFYFGKGKKVLFFEDGSFLECEWNEKLRRLEYSPIKVAVWVNKLAKKNE
jgi:hypothetical protein